MKRRTVMALAGAAAIVLGLGEGHRLLARRGASCPASSATSPAALERQRLSALPELRGAEPSPSGEALGFELGVTARERLVAESEARGAVCVTENGGALVRCAGQEGGDVVARFDLRGVLVGADRLRYVARTEVACAVYEGLAAAGVRRYGAPTRAWGESSPSYLSRPLRQVGVAYRFVDVAVDVSATHVGGGKIAIREQVRAIPHAPGRGG